MSMNELIRTNLPRTPSSDCLEVFQEADGALQDFKNFMHETFPKASSLYESAKWLWQDVHDLRVKHADDKQVAALFAKQTETWNKLQAGAEQLRILIKEKYANVSSQEDKVKKARGSGPSLAALGFPTPDQEAARYVYNRKFKYAFHDAKDEVAMMCNFPDGMLVQIRLLRGYAEKMAAVGGEPPKPPVKPHLDVADEADQVLQEFKKFMAETYTKASALHERAKWLWQEVHDLRVSKAADMQVVALLEHQAETWTRLEKDSAELRQAIEKEFAKVTDVEDRVKKARGVYPNVAALGFPTPEQRLARHMYARQYKFAFHDAKDEYAKMVGFPDGMLNKIQQVHRYALKTAGPAGEAATNEPAAE